MGEVGMQERRKLRRFDHTDRIQTKGTEWSSKNSGGGEKCK